MPSEPIFYEVLGGYIALFAIALLLMLCWRAYARRQQERFERHCERVRNEVQHRAESRHDRQVHMHSHGGCRVSAEERWSA